ncbi:MAG TPA: hypothetical protein VGA70_07275, partial [Longimicrobiales bacterium]
MLRAGGRGDARHRRAGALSRFRGNVGARERARLEAVPAGALAASLFLRRSSGAVRHAFWSVT